LLGGAEVNLLLKEIRHNPLLWLLALVPVALIAAKLVPDAHTLLFVLSVLAIVGRRRHRCRD
jgi:Ca2+:H+ antiporter